MEMRNGILPLVETKDRVALYIMRAMNEVDLRISTWEKEVFEHMSPPRRSGKFFTE